MLKSTYRLSQQVAIEFFSEGALVLDLCTRDLTELNQTACDIIRFTDGRHTMLEVAQSLAEEYEIPGEDALNDVYELYIYLIKINLVEKLEP